MWMAKDSAIFVQSSQLNWYEHYQDTDWNDDLDNEKSSCWILKSHFGFNMADPTLVKAAEATNEDDFVVTIEKVAGKINYKKLIERFGSSPIPQSLVDRVERITKKPAHPFLKRGFFFSHRCVFMVIMMWPWELKNDHFGKSPGFDFSSFDSIFTSVLHMESIKNRYLEW